MTVCFHVSFHYWTEQLFSITGLKGVKTGNMTDDITQTLAEVAVLNDDTCILYLINSI